MLYEQPITLIDLSCVLQTNGVWKGRCNIIEPRVI